MGHAIRQSGFCIVSFWFDAFRHVDHNGTVKVCAALPGNSDMSARPHADRDAFNLQTPWRGLFEIESADL